MKTISHIFILTTLLAISNSAIAQDITGQWKTIDDKTGEARSIIKLYIVDGKLYGKIIKTLIVNTNKDSNDTGDKAVENSVGVVIIKGLEKEGNFWKKDRGIFYPEKDTYYDIKIWLENDQLMVRCYLGCLFRTQMWQRA